MPGERQSLYAVPSTHGTFGALPLAGLFHRYQHHNRQPCNKAANAGRGLADPVQRGLQILGIGALEVDPLAAAGVSEPEADSVQPLTFEP